MVKFIKLKISFYLRKSDLFYKVYNYAKLLFHYLYVSQLRKEIKSIKHETNFESNGNILLATSSGFYNPALNIDFLLKEKLLVKGYSVYSLLCDKFLPACHLCEIFTYSDTTKFIKEGPQNKCQFCYATGKYFYDNLDFKLLNYSQFVTEKELSEANKLVLDCKTIEDLFKLEFRGVKIGEQIRAAVIRFYAKIDLQTESSSFEIGKKYAIAAIYTVSSIQRIIKDFKITKVILHHGVYVPQGVIVDVCKKLNIDVVCWHPSYRKLTFIFSKGDTYHRTLLDEKDEYLKHCNFETNEYEKIEKYLESRKEGGGDWIHFNRKPLLLDRNQFTAKYNIDRSKKIFVLYTNVLWDAQLHYKQNIFANMLEWIYFTIENLPKNAYLIIRIHPAEVTGNIPSRQKVYDELLRKYKDIPPNVIIIQPYEKMSSYDLSFYSDVVLIYASKISIELSAMLDKPVMVIGEAFIKNKNLVFEVRSQDEYKVLLENIIGQENTFSRKNAIWYAYYFFLKRMIYLGNVIEYKSGKSEFSIRIRKGVLKSGVFQQDENLNAIVDGILSDQSIIASKQ